MKAIASPTHFQLSRQIPSCLDQVDRLCREIRVVLREHGLASVSFAFELLARECLNNAVIHGNGGSRAKRVTLEIKSTKSGVSLRVLDEGAGFDRKKMGSESGRDSNATSGRGLKIINTYAERVRFNRKGNQITVWLRK